MLKTLKHIGGENMSIEECLKKISEIRKDDISGSEENVRQKVIIPFFACFGHIHQTDIEHTTNRGSVDVFLKGLPDNSSVIVEVKPIHKKIEANEISQLKGYVEDTNALLAIISNGENFQIYSPYWRGKAFEKTLIFNFNRGDLQESALIEELDKILCRENLKNSRTHKLLFERESLIDNRINIEYDCKNLEKQIAKFKLKFKEANCEEAINHLIKYRMAMGENITKEDAIADFLKNKPELREIYSVIKQNKVRIMENYELLESKKIIGLQEIKPLIVIPKRDDLTSDKIYESEKKKERPTKMNIGPNSYEITYSNEILINTANWLIENDMLKKSDCPISAGTIRNLINVEPMHKNEGKGKSGQKFRSPKTLSNGLFIETSYTTANCINYARELLKKYSNNRYTLEVYFK